MSDDDRLIDKWEDKTATDLHVWMHSEIPEHHRRVAPWPVVYKCHTCNGEGERCLAMHSLHKSSCKPEDIGPCPDCVSGWVTRLGTIEQRCTEHNSEAGAFWDQQCAWFHWMGVGDDDVAPCAFGLVLVIPVGDDE